MDQLSLQAGDIVETYDRKTLVITETYAPTGHVSRVIAGDVPFTPSGQWIGGARINGGLGYDLRDVKRILYSPLTEAKKAQAA